LTFTVEFSTEGESKAPRSNRYPKGRHSGLASTASESEGPDGLDTNNTVEDG